MLHINYVTPSSIVPSIGAILSKRGKVVADTASNALIVTDTRSRVDEVADFVKNLDVRTPQVSIQSKLIFVDRTDISNLGLQYDLGDNQVFFNKLVQRTDASTGDPFDKNSIFIGGQSVAAVANSDAVITGSALNLVFRTAIGGFNLTTFLSALQQGEPPRGPAGPPGPNRNWTTGGLVRAVALGYSYEQVLLPIVGPAVMLGTGIVSRQRDRLAERLRRGRVLLAAATVALIASTGWSLAAAGYRSAVWSFGYYANAVSYMSGSISEEAYDGYFGVVTYGEAEAERWMNTHGLTGVTGMVW